MHTHICVYIFQEVGTPLPTYIHTYCVPLFKYVSLSIFGLFFVSLSWCVCVCRCVFVHKDFCICTHTIPRHISCCTNSATHTHTCTRAHKHTSTTHAHMHSRARAHTHMHTYFDP